MEKINKFLQGLFNKLTNIHMFNSPLYLNTPVEKHEDDIIGYDACANAIDNAIRKKAQMIAITSPFGAGKTSVIGLLKEKRYKKIKKIRRLYEKTIHVPMWSQLNHENISSTELHKHLVYQIAKEINAKKGTYIRRRLSENYGLAKIHINKKRYLFYILIAAFLWFLGGLIKEQKELFIEYFPRYEDYISLFDAGLKAMGVLIAVFPILKSEIIISTPKSEKNRKIEEDEIIDIYRNEVLQPYSLFYLWIRHRYIIVIEDLDRSDANKEVLEFLQELRKYYMPEGQGKVKVRNKVIFIVNIKPESLLVEEETQHMNNDDLIYAKLFDYVLNIRTINIDDYEAILDNLLRKEKDKFIRIGIVDNDYKGKMTDISGMQWLIRGKKLSIRKIKHRINKAVVAYESLKERFGNDVSFEKCAVYAYLSTDYENELQLVDDYAFEKLTEKRMKGEITREDCAMELPGDNEFHDAICELVNSKHIDYNYRVYFYNHPKDSRIYTHDERMVQNAILYEDNYTDLNDAVKRLIENNSDIIKTSLLRREKLGLKVSNAVFSSDLLFGETVRYSYDSILDWVRNLDYSKDKIEETIKTIIRALHLDSQRLYYKGEKPKALCDIWTSLDSSTPCVFEIRKSLCANFPEEILLYKELFKSPHRPISDEEYKLLPFDKAIELVDADHVEYSMGNIKEMLDAFEEQKEYSLYENKVQSILDKAIEKFKNPEMAHLLLRYMKKIQRLISKYEVVVAQNIDKKSISEDSVFLEYQALVNDMAGTELSIDTLDNISQLDYFIGYSEHIIDQLLDKEFYVDAIVMSMYCNRMVDYDNPSIVKAVEDYQDWLFEHKLFPAIRYHITYHVNNIMLYKFMFDKIYPCMTEKEFDNIKNKTDISDILQLLHTELIDKDFAILLVNYWNSTNITKEQAFQIIMFISIMQNETTHLCIESLDYTKRIHYYAFSKQQKNEIKKNLETIMELNEIKGRITFMGLTRTADYDWISSDAAAIYENAELERMFIDSMNNCYSGTITNRVLHFINNTRREYAFNEQIDEKLKINNMYKKYVESKILKDGLRGFTELETTDPLWYVYVDLFINSSNSEIMKCFSDDYEFLQITMKNKIYKEVSEIKRMYYASVKQDVDCLNDIVSGKYNNEYVITYLSKIYGFEDYWAAKAFIDNLDGNDYILKSDDVYKNTYEKLWDGILKGKYTRKRREKGYME